jgi:hypothetical protein
MTDLQAIIVFILLSISLGSLLLLLLPAIKDLIYKHRYMEIFHKTIIRIAEDQDYQLINPVLFKLDDSTFLKIDHLLFGDKFIFVIKDEYYNGALLGKLKDQNWLFHHYDKQKGKFIKNPFVVNARRIEKLSLLTQLKEDFFVSIIVVNDEAMIDRVSRGDNFSYIVSIKKLPRVIAAFEDRNVMKLDAEKTQLAVNSIYRLSEENKKLFKGYRKINS